MELEIGEKSAVVAAKTEAACARILRVSCVAPEITPSRPERDRDEHKQQELVQQSGSKQFIRYMETVSLFNAATSHKIA